MRYTPKNLDEVRTCLGGCPAEMEVEVERGIPLTANTVAKLRALPTWPPGEVDVFPQDVDGLIEVFDPDIRPQIEDQRQAGVWPV
jgi:hypothetical protein